MHKIDVPADTAILKSSSKALLLMSAPGCQDTPLLKDRMKLMTVRYSSLVVCSADVRKVPGLAAALGLKKFPAIVLFRRGQHAGELQGRATGRQMQDLIESVPW